MPEEKTYTAYYKPVPLKAWFYIQVILLFLLLLGIVYGLVMVFNGEGEKRDWFSIFHFIILISVTDRLIKQYRSSKINHCFVSVNEEGIAWRLPEGNYKVRPKEIIVWSDIKKIKIDQNGITIKYMSTYFTDTIPFATIALHEREQLLAVLREHINSRAIVSEDRLAA